MCYHFFSLFLLVCSLDILQFEWNVQFLVFFSTFFLQCIDYDVLFKNVNTNAAGEVIPDGTKRHFGVLYSVLLNITIYDKEFELMGGFCNNCDLGYCIFTLTYFLVLRFWIFHFFRSFQDAIVPECASHLNPLIVFAILVALIFWISRVVKTGYILLQLREIQVCFIFFTSISRNRLMILFLGVLSRRAVDKRRTVVEFDMALYCQADLRGFWSLTLPELRNVNVST